MKTSVACFRLFRMVALLQLYLFVTSCSLIGDDYSESGVLRLRFEEVSSLNTKAIESMPDTSDFLLSITDAAGKVIFNGKFGDCPEKLEVKAGSYVIKALSGEFDKPAFSSPLYGDEVCVIVPSGGSAEVRLSCSQLNAGVRLNVDKSFLNGCPDGSLFLKSDQGKLLYSYTEKRIAYFQPGPVSLILSLGGKDEVLLTRNLQPRQVLVLGISVAQSSSGSQHQGFEGLTVSVDTSKVWVEDSYVIGGSSGKGGSSANAMTVALAISNGPQENIWVSGYVVGGDLTSASASFEEPFKSRTNILLGPKSSTTDRDACIAVQLPDGKVRDALNLVDNPDMLGRKVCLKGDLVDAYFCLTGLKSVDEYVF